MMLTVSCGQPLLRSREQGLPTDRAKCECRIVLTILVAGTRRSLANAKQQREFS